MEHPFFEQYKVYPGQWPWKEDPEGFEDLFWKTIKNELISNFLLIPVGGIVVLMKDGFEIKHSFRIEDLPDSWTLAWQMIFCMWI